MKFYDCSTAPSPRRVRIFIAEKGIDIETVQIDLAAGEQFSDEFRRINPDCVVPVLKLDDGGFLSEATAICQYLEARFPDPPLLGTSPEETARITMWNTKIEQQGLHAMAEAFRNSAKGLKGRAITGAKDYEQIPELARRGRERVAQFFDRLNRQLADNPYVAGERFSMADITALVVVDFARWTKIGVPDDATHLTRWYDEVSSRPGAVP